MSSAAPPVSIGLPVYNAERYLMGCLESLLGQTYGDFELFIADNASGDATEELCREAARRDGRIRYERREKNHGAVGNFNYACERARGRYFKWAAYDDRCAPTFLERCVERLEEDAGVAWCHPLTRHIGPDGEVVPPEVDPALPPGADSHSLLNPPGLRYDRAAERPWQRFRAVTLGTTWCSDAFGLFRTDALRRTRLYLPCFGAEKLLMAEVALLGRFAEPQEVLFDQRVHPGAASNLRNRSAEAAFATGGVARRFSTARLTLLRGYLSAIRRADLPAADRARCLATLALYVGQVGKWRRVLHHTLSGRGLGDDTWKRIAAAKSVAAASPGPR
ncbi:glycosyltransferase family 2 protein [Alienimonas californiensis]|uniref:Chondroitin synthase n=1 Tax=Alienimonas californiensis TaxID=2527989 RepID=A0A517P426_9PLAN|nr:glycosyltransferase family 2 protein [Alienimonas californiensis]QDT14137.1 Chondroitin synthase [Alienimonas californiensis]